MVNLGDKYFKDFKGSIMGYYTRIIGEISPNRELSDREQEILHDAFMERDLAHKVEIDECGNVDFSQSDEGSFYDGEIRLVAIFEKFAQTLQTLRAQELNIGDNDLSPVLFNGVLDLEGEANDDIWKIIVEDNIFYTQCPRIVWDDEDKVKIS